MQKTVFVVDDSDVSLTLAKQALGTEYNVLTMPSAERMFNMLEKITPDIILLDVEMSGENGLDALRRLKASEQANIPVILFTGTRDEEVEKTGFALGAAGFLEKPFSLRSMLGYVALQLDE